MPERVAVVTDSTAYLPSELADRHQLTVVPLHVVIGGRALTEGSEVSSADLAAALRAGRPVTTSRPAPQVFAETYRELGRSGAREIVSVHLSGELSGTVAAARLAAREVAADGIRVQVVDSRSMGMGLGWAAITAAESVAAGASAADAAEAATRRALATSIWFYVDTLEYLRRGGRIGAAQAMLGSALAVKPLLLLVDGRLELVDRVRTASRALIRLEELVVEEEGERPVDVAVHHLAAPERAEEVGRGLRDRLPGLRTLHIGEVGAVVGAHVGPGMLGIVAAPVRADRSVGQPG